MPLTRRKNPRPQTFAMIGLVVAIGFVFSFLSEAPSAKAQAPKSKTVELDTAPPEKKRDDPKARAVFDQLCTAYKALSSYADNGEFIVAMTAGGKADKQVAPLKITLIRPNKFEVSTNLVKLTSDGTTLTTSVLPLKRFMSVPAPPKVDIDVFREGPIGASLFGGPSGVPMFVLLNLLTASDPGAAIAQIGGSLQFAAPVDPKSNGSRTENRALLIDLGKGAPGVLLTIDPASKLLSSIDLKIGPEMLKDQNTTIEKLGWSSGAISTQVPKDRSFALEIPKGFTKVDTSLEAQQEAHATDPRVGKPAPNFTLTLLDGVGKTKTVTKAELAGKVVLIDFWATWCGPCLKELPEIQKLIESCANTKKDVLVVALSQDDDPAELAQVRTLVEKTLAEKKINLTGSPVGRIGLDPSKSVGTAFELEGYPTLVIMDGKGLVQSVHVGFNPDAAEPLSKSLAKEIDTLLEGKSLVSPKPKGNEASRKNGE